MIRYKNIDLCIRCDIQVKYSRKEIIASRQSRVVGDIPSGFKGVIK